MAKHVPDDVVERILLRLDVKDLIRCKSVCHSWESIISTPFFVKAHLKHAYMIDHNNHELGDRRVCLDTIVGEDTCCMLNYIHIVGSCNGLLCVSPRGFKLVVTNPSTRKHRKLPRLPYQLRYIRNYHCVREVVSWGFGYDSVADDYKVIVGFMKKKKRTCSKVTVFHSLTLKSNIWKFIGQGKYWRFSGAVTGILCNGALHWFMICKKKNEKKKKKNVILSLDLSTEEFKEIPLPGANLLYEYYFNHILGVIEECLCIHIISDRPSTKKWVMRNNKWELFIDDHCQRKYDVAHHLPITLDGQMNSSDCVDDGNIVPANGIHVRASIFVKSLVSPYPHGNDDNNNHDDGQQRIAKDDMKSAERVTKGNTRKRKRSKRSCKLFKPLYEA